MWPAWMWWRCWSIGVHFGEHCCVAAVGVDIDGVEQPLSVVEGST
jgi:hypothetical protein